MISHFPALDDVTELLGCPDRTELPEALENVTNIFASFGLDVRDIRDELLRGLLPEAQWSEGLIGARTVTDDEIAACYRRLRDTAESGDKETYQHVMARLRELQAVEAQQIRRSFETDLDHPHVDEALRRADELLAQYESPPR